MKAIKITAENMDAIESALLAVNGKAKEHVFTAAIELLHISDRAEGRLDAIGIPKADRKGARFIQESGEKLPSAYKYAARTTRVVIERRASGWWVIDISESSIYPASKPFQRMTLTEAQDAKAVANLRKTYNVGE